MLKTYNYIEKKTIKPVHVLTQLNVNTYIF